MVCLGYAKGFKSAFCHALAGFAGRQPKIPPSCPARAPAMDPKAMYLKPEC
jgi:hypothetical protein